MNHPPENPGVHTAWSYPELFQVLEAEPAPWWTRYFGAAIAAVRITICNILIAILRRTLGLRRTPPGQVRSVIVYTVGILGDNVVMLPALRALRDRYQGARITVVNNSQIWDGDAPAQLLQSSPYIDRFLPVTAWDCPVQRRGLGFEVVVPELLGETCDLFVNLSPFGNRGWFGAVLREMVWARKLRAKCAVGFRVSSYCRTGPLRRISHRYFQNEPRRYLSILQELGLTAARPALDTSLPVCSASREAVRRKLVAKGVDLACFVVVNPGAKFAANRWPVERFASVIRWIAKATHHKAVVTGTKSEVALAHAVVDGAEGRGTPDHGTTGQQDHGLRDHGGGGRWAVSLSGETSVAELIELVRMARLCVTNDTGTMHIAAALGVPVVAIFSRRHSPQNWFPDGREVAAIFASVGCDGCGLEVCESMECLRKVEVEDVVLACGGMLGERETVGLWRE